MNEVYDKELSRAREALASGNVEVCLVPNGNGGRTRVCAVKPMAVPEDLRRVVP